MFNVDKDIFGSARKTYLAFAALWRLLFIVLVLSLVYMIAIGLRDDALWFLAERSVWGMYLSGFLTSSSLWWAFRWSAARAED